MKSHTVTIPPIIAGVHKGQRAIEDRHHTTITWIDENSDAQKKFLPLYAETIYQIHELMPELETIADTDVTVINEFLEAKGFDIRLEAFRDEHSIGTASVLDLLLKWKRGGTRAEIDKNGVKYDAVKLGKNVASFFNADGRTVVCVATESDDKVYMTPLAGLDYDDDIDALQIPLALRTDFRPSRIYDGVTFPMVSLNHEVDITWIRNLYEKDTGMDYYIRQSLQQTKFDMNENGAEVKSAAAFECAGSGFYMSAPQPYYVIDEPFMVWVERPGVGVPIFMGFCHEDSWKDPERGSEFRKVEEYQDPLGERDFWPWTIVNRPFHVVDGKR
jgi:hypothetical protein